MEKSRVKYLSLYLVDNKITDWLSFLHVADEESESEEQEGQSGEDAKEPRDSGCFESSENLENGREEPKTEEELQFEVSEEKTNQPPDTEKQESEEGDEKQLETVQEQLQDLTVDGDCWGPMGKYSNLFFLFLVLEDSVDGGLMSLTNSSSL